MSELMLRVRLITLDLRSASMAPTRPPLARPCRRSWRRLQRGVAASEAHPRAHRSSSYRSIRGSPKCGKTLVSVNQVIADIRWPSSVRTTNEDARAMSVCAAGR